MSAIITPELPTYFYAKTATMEYFILMMGVIFGYSLTFLMSFTWAGLCMWAYMIVFHAIEKWDNPKEHRSMRLQWLRRGASP